VADDVIVFLLVLIVSLLLDATVRPRRRRIRRATGVMIHILAMSVAFGFWLTVSGSVPVAGILTIVIMALLVVASNAKFAMLGEPLVFSDLALVAAILRHPRFYFTAVPFRQRCLAAFSALAALAALLWLVSPALVAHVAGVALLGLAAAALFALFASNMLNVAHRPALDQDVSDYGLLATLLLYWLRWRDSVDPPPCPALAMSQRSQTPELIVVVQCESFADPVALTGDPSTALPGLTAARAKAWQWGELAVSGFGAYTMRTEYGVLFGRSEDELGFRRYDPFLTARGEASYAMPSLLQKAGYQCSFVHPHDLRFYGRDRLMPAIGFERMIGEKDVVPDPADSGRYLGDKTLGVALHQLIASSGGATMIYAVTMENHGPWDKDREPGSAVGLEAYLRHLQNSDAMLAGLSDALAADGRPAMLVFFGDHRPSIPNVIEPRGERHTPYVILRFDTRGQPITGKGQIDLSPAALHHTILRAVAGHC
jgi:hypothetical protein